MSPHPSQRYELADGSLELLPVCTVEVEWEGQWLIVLAAITDGDVLLGMQLLRGHRVTMDVVAGGPVSIDPLP